MLRGHDGKEDQALEQDGARLVGDDVHRLGIDDADLLDGPDVAVLGGLLLRIEHPVEGVLDILRRHRLAVVELDPLAELELPGGVVRDLPRERASPGSYSSFFDLWSKESNMLMLTRMPDAIEVHVGIERRRVVRERQHEGVLLGEGPRRSQRHGEEQCNRGVQDFHPVVLRCSRVDGYAEDGREAWSSRGTRGLHASRETGSVGMIRKSCRRCQVGGSRPAPARGRRGGSPAPLSAESSASQHCPRSRRYDRELRSSALRAGRLELGHRPRQLPEVPDHAMGRRRAARCPRGTAPGSPASRQRARPPRRAPGRLRRAPRGPPERRGAGGSSGRSRAPACARRPHRRRSGGRTGRAGRETPGPSAGRARASASCSTARRA